MKQLALLAIILLSFSCKKSVNTDLSKPYVAKVGNHILTVEEYHSLLPNTLNIQDSLILSENIISTWVKESLMYDLAKSNLHNEEEINQLVENYKRSLITYQYQDRLIKEKMSGEISEKEMKEFYDENADKFKVETTLIKGLFLKIPKDAPEINKIKEWYKSPSIKNIEKIEKYSFQNAVNYDYFYDRWVILDEVMRLFPGDLAQNLPSLIQQKQVEMQDSTYFYLLNINEARFAGEKEPYEFAKKNVKDVLINQKRLDFLRNFENDLYQTAVQKGLVKRAKN